jgi:farnesyl-diphosphate farnesyltransferase
MISIHPNTGARLRMHSPEASPLDGARRADLEYQAAILPGVSRTFALTIPALPARLGCVVTNAYLLCRLADTIEDDIGLTNADKSVFHGRFVNVVEGNESAEAFAAALEPLLSTRVLDDERDLVRNTAKVVRVTHGFSQEEQAALIRCVRIMCSGMPEFQRRKSLKGLRDLEEMGSYCYFVAGVVGEMLTQLFCLHSAEINQHRDHLMQLAVSFGQGLQMTNILKDIWDDREAKACWLPRSVFGDDKFRLEALDEEHRSEAFVAGLNKLVGVAHAHLRDAMEYTCLIPKREAGIRKFCFWAIGLAVMTLRKIHRNPAFTSGAEVKVSRRTVKATVVTTNLTLKSNRALRLIFARAADGLPLASPNSWRERASYGAATEVS